jgi:hypothetical protein
MTFLPILGKPRLTGNEVVLKEGLISKEIWSVLFKTNYFKMADILLIYDDLDPNISKEK